jgi:hypothetical protein
MRDFSSSSRQIIEMSDVSVEVRLHVEVAGDRATTIRPTSYAMTRLLMRDAAPPTCGLLSEDERLSPKHRERGRVVVRLRVEYYR